MPNVPQGPDRPRDPIEENIRGMLQRMRSPVPVEQIMETLRIEAMGRTGRDAENAIIVRGGNPVSIVLVSLAIANNHIETTRHQPRGRGSRVMNGAMHDVYTIQGPEGLYELWIRFEDALQES